MIYKKLSNSEVYDFIAIIRNYIMKYDEVAQIEKDLSEKWYNEYLSKYSPILKKPMRKDDFYQNIMVYVVTGYAYKKERFLRKYTSCTVFHEFLLYENRNSTPFYVDTKLYLSNFENFGDINNFELDDQLVTIYNKCIEKTKKLKTYIDIINKQTK